MYRIHTDPGTGVSAHYENTVAYCVCAVIQLCVLHTVCFVLQDWKNQFISWDPDECGADSITIPRKKLWEPDVVINEL